MFRKATSKELPQKIKFKKNETKEENQYIVPCTDCHVVNLVFTVTR